MKKLLIALSLFFTVSAYAQNANHCYMVETRREGGNCDEFSWRATNTCNQAIDVHMCHERNNGTWTCGLDIIEAGETSDWATSLDCNPTGENCSSARVSGSSVRFADAKYIEANGCE